MNTISVLVSIGFHYCLAYRSQLLVRVCDDEHGERPAGLRTDVHLRPRHRARGAGGPGHEEVHPGPQRR